MTGRAVLPTAGIGGHQRSRVIKRYGHGLLIAVLCVVCAGGSVQTPDARPDNPIIRFDLSRLNDDGLYGPPDGLRALDYEFCIPSGKKHVREIKAIDPSATVYPRSTGRIGCTSDQSLVIGNTRQPDFRTILKALAAQPYVTRIDQSFFE